MQTKNLLDTDVQFIKGVGPRRAKLLKRLGIQTTNDLITYFPRDWEDRSRIVLIGEAKPGEKVLIRGRVELLDILHTQKRLKIFKVAVSDQTGIVYALWFKRDNPHYDVFSKLRKSIQRGKEILVYGSVLPPTAGNYKELSVEICKVLNGSPAESNLHLGRIVPLYHLTEGVNEEFFRELVRTALNSYLSFTKDILPESLKNRHNLLSYRDALEAIHFPKNFAEKQKAYHRLVFEEFFLFQLALALKRQKVKKTFKHHTYQIKRNLLTPFRKNLGFDFTKTQKKVINEIFYDLQSSSPMNRLLQGDVGSGKTVVALSAILLATENNYQSAFLAPTEILAEQHYLTFKHFLRGLPINFALLTSKTSRKERKNILEKLKTGEISILLGTHALLEKKVTFRNLKLVVIDEQHRFGVIQRAQIREKGENPDVLVLTATPIPRSLALTLYGDLDVSLLNELPPGRQKIETLHLSETEAYNFVKSTVADGRQAYIVYPLIEESDKLELKAATTEAERLKKDIFFHYRVGLIHGQLPGKEKEEIMSVFREKKYHILIATTVIEVGIDIPNATIMVIEHADRFGLATLHQLRGRIGRGGEKSYCILLGAPKTEEARRRREIMLSTTDGFRIAEEDLKLRGPGEFFGTVQHGLPEYKIGNPLRDYQLLQQTNKLASVFLKKDFWQPTASELRTVVYRKYGQGMQLLEIG
ncbi:MAG TPA: DNA helicase RecG [Elusimicrobia bacterium]|jgi:ATP-dependent DNA helicase RecG|nr:DNA helicase RecG [Elusimicrobiota bacterium]